MKSKPQKFDFMEFCTLGVHNDTRGKDSVGIFIDGKTEYYCKGKGQSLFSDFIPESKLLQSVDIAQVAYGHDRAASVGTVSIETAQPVVIKEGDEIKYVLMHNGTIYNYDDLAKKYIPDVNIKGMTDSQVMARIFYYKGYEALGEYNGAAVFAIIDYREEKPKYLFWQGHSKLTSYSQGKIEEERPLYFLKSEGELMFSSLNTYLNAFRRKAERLVPTPNILIEYNPETQEFISVEEYDRSNCSQGKIYNYAVAPTATASNNDYYVDNSYSATYISCREGLFYLGNTLLHGHHKVTTYGYVNPSTTYKPEPYDMYFYNGVLLKNQEAYIYLTKFTKEMGITADECYKWYPECVAYLSPYPFIRKYDNCILKVYKVIDPITIVPFSGDLVMPFTSQLKHYSNGIYQSVSNVSMQEGIREYNEHKNDRININDLLVY